MSFASSSVPTAPSLLATVTPGPAERVSSPGHAARAASPPPQASTSLVGSAPAEPAAVNGAGAVASEARSPDAARAIAHEYHTAEPSAGTNSSRPTSPPSTSGNEALRSRDIHLMPVAAVEDSSSFLRDREHFAAWMHEILMAENPQASVSLGFPEVLSKTPLVVNPVYAQPSRRRRRDPRRAGSGTATQREASRRRRRAVASKAVDRGRVAAYCVSQSVLTEKLVGALRTAHRKASTELSSKIESSNVDQISKLATLTDPSIARIFPPASIVVEPRNPFAIPDPERGRTADAASSLHWSESIRSKSRPTEGRYLQSSYQPPPFRTLSASGSRVTTGPRQHGPSLAQRLGLTTPSKWVKDEKPVHIASLPWKWKEHMDVVHFSLEPDELTKLSVAVGKRSSMTSPRVSDEGEGGTDQGRGVWSWGDVLQQVMEEIDPSRHRLRVRLGMAHPAGQKLPEAMSSRFPVALRRQISDRASIAAARASSSAATASSRWHVHTQRRGAGSESSMGAVDEEGGGDDDDDEDEEEDDDDEEEEEDEDVIALTKDIDPSVYHPQILGKPAVLHHEVDAPHGMALSPVMNPMYENVGVTEAAPVDAPSTTMSILGGGGGGSRYNRLESDDDNGAPHHSVTFADEVSIPSGSGSLPVIAEARAATSSTTSSEPASPQRDMSELHHHPVATIPPTVAALMTPDHSARATAFLVAEAVQSGYPFAGDGLEPIELPETAVSSSFPTGGGGIAGRSPHSEDASRPASAVAGGFIASDGSWVLVDSFGRHISRVGRSASVSASRRRKHRVLRENMDAIRFSTKFPRRAGSLPGHSHHHQKEPVSLVKSSSGVHRRSFHGDEFGTPTSSTSTPSVPPQEEDGGLVTSAEMMPVPDPSLEIDPMSSSLPVDPFDPVEEEPMSSNIPVSMWGAAPAPLPSSSSSPPRIGHPLSIHAAEERFAEEFPGDKMPGHSGTDTDGPPAHGGESSSAPPIPRPPPIPSLRRRDVLVFPFGCIVFWGFTGEEEERSFASRLLPFLDTPLQPGEFDDMTYKYDSTNAERRANKQPLLKDHVISLDEIKLSTPNPLERLAVSYAFAQSVKLSVLEERVARKIEDTRDIPQQMAKTGRINLSGREITQRIGELFIERSSINLTSDLLDSPEFLWESDEFQDVYESVQEYLDISQRVGVLNQRLDIIAELLNILMSQQQHHGFDFLEWIVIWLIVISVVVEVFWSIIIVDVLGFFQH
jgi:uncharacterized Rmd1/YagE family protein